MIVAAALVAFATPAMAQEVANAPVGLRAEARAGLDYVHDSLDATDGTTTLHVSEHSTGLVYGGEVGFDARVSQFATVGVYGGIDGSSTKACGEVYGNDAACLRAGRNFSAGVRLGYMFNPNGVFYVKGGYSNGRIQADYTDGNDLTNNFRLADNRDGFHAGVGAEIGFGSHLYGKAEYLYTNYNSYDYLAGINRLSLDFDRHQAVAGLGVRF